MPTNREHPSDLPPQPWLNTAPTHGDLSAAKALVYDSCGFTCSQPVPEAEGAAYAAHEFTLDGLSIRFRTARTTPTKAGQFCSSRRRCRPARRSWSGSAGSRPGRGPASGRRAGR
ncbi:MepB family protein [Kitasatospora herbaricolor]|uniref:MepB family protein n=1 Tax=Kitasatospora herbaricolor TaxID=68217 RepID=UPI00174DA1D8